MTTSTCVGQANRAARVARSCRRRGRCPLRLAWCALLLLGLGHGSAVAETADGLRIANILVEGNSKTQTYLIVAASELSPGMVIDTETLAQARQRILNKRVFVDARVEAFPQGETAPERMSLAPSAGAARTGREGSSLRLARASSSVFGIVAIDFLPTQTRIGSSAGRVLHCDT